MGRKVIFELKLTETDSIIAYEKRNYETCYEDSLLFLNVAGQKIKIVESSFCYGFGAEMYYRIYNINNFDKSAKSFVDLLKEYLDSMTFNDDYNPEDPESVAFYTSVEFEEMDYCFAYGKSSVDKFTHLFLYKNKDGYKVLFVELWEDKKIEKYETKLLNEFSIGEKTFSEWKKVISAEWEKRAVIEGERIIGEKESMEEWQKYFEYMRTDTTKK